MKASDLKKASSPAQHKRMLSLAAAAGSDPEITCRYEPGEQDSDTNVDPMLTPNAEENGKICIYTCMQ